MKIKMNKTVLLTGLLTSVVGLVGCSSNTTQVKEIVDIDKQNYTMESVKKNSTPVDYLEKTNIKFQNYKYGDRYIGLVVDLMVHEDKPIYELGISIPAGNRNKIAFKEQLNLAINSIGFTDKDVETIYSKIDECLSDEYLNSEKITKKIEEDNFIIEKLLKNKESKVTMTLESPDRYDCLIRVQIETNKNNIDEYLKSSKIKFNYADYINSKNGLNLSQSVFGEDCVSLGLIIPLKNIKDTEFRDQLELMVKSVGGTDKDFKKALSVIDSKLNADKTIIVKISNDFDINIDIQESEWRGGAQVYINITNDPIDFDEDFADNFIVIDKDSDVNVIDITASSDDNEIDVYADFDDNEIYEDSIDDIFSKFKDLEIKNYGVSS